jgi:lipoprotein-releasing system ATP-binding protein
VLRGVNLSLAPGQSMALLGPSGSGKSTLLNILGTLESPTTGEYTLDGVDPFSLPEAAQSLFRNSKIGFVFQEHHLLPQLSALENVLLPSLMSRERKTFVDRAAELLARVGLGERLEHYPSELSGGERQRVALARALIHRPALLLADEPTGNLDRRTAATVADLLLELHRAERNMLIVVTHAEDLAQRFGMRFSLEDGRLVERA